uniref:non-specific serine/threonine protein kinase n=1 Tax=Culicoides sonorensis TaxID=179676 RepID=A0A336MEQ0_CULSO
MKVIKKAAIIQKKKTAEHTRTERQVLEAVRKCPFLITMHYAFQTDSKLHLVLDYVNGGELFTHLYQREQFSEDEVRVYIAEIVLALEQLHKLGIIYRDIKLENILLDKDGHIVITDFGLSKELLPDTNGRAHSFCGTIEYMAPEVVKNNSNGHDIAVDWWSVGVLTYELLTGASPFTIEGERNTQSEISRRILRTEPPLRGMGAEVKDFIEKLLVKDPRRRLGGNAADASELKSHPFFNRINWSLLEQRKVAAPFVPRITDELDTSNFSEEFTRLPVTDSPSEPPPNHERLFKGYSFVAPSILLTKNAISDVILECSGDKLSKKPNAVNVIRLRMEEVGNAKLAQRRRHKKSTSCSRSSDESSTSELGRSKSSSNIIITSDPNCRSISSGVATASSDAEYKSTSNSKSQNSNGRQIIISISDDEEEMPTNSSLRYSELSDRRETMTQIDMKQYEHYDISKSLDMEPDLYGFQIDDFYGFSSEEIALQDSTKDFISNWLERPVRTGTEIKSKKIRRKRFPQEFPITTGGPTTRSRIRTRRPSGSLIENSASESASERSSSGIKRSSDGPLRGITIKRLS